MSTFLTSNYNLYKFNTPNIPGFYKRTIQQVDFLQHLKKKEEDLNNLNQKK